MGRLVVVSLVASMVVVGVVGGPAGAAEPPPSYIATWGQSGAGNGQFRQPYDVAVGPDGSVYVADLLNQRIQRFTAAGTFVTAWGSFGTGNGQFHDPYGVTVDNDGYVYVADEYNHRIQKFTSNGVFVTKWGSNGTANGRFQGPVGVAVDADGFVYVADNYNHRIQKFTSTGVFIAKWGSFGTGDGQFDRAYGLAVDADGFVYVADYNNHRVQKFTSTGVFVTKWGSFGSGDGQFNYPVRVAVDDHGGVYVADTTNYRVEKFTSTGTYLSQWGSPGDGNGEFGGAYGLSATPTGEVYVADTANDRVQVFGDTTDPTVTLTAPTDGATVSLNEVVAADFSCVDEAGGSGIATCAGTVADGSPIDTSTVGDHDFTVVGTDRAGNTRQVTHTYRVLDSGVAGTVRENAVGDPIGEGIWVVALRASDYSVAAGGFTDSQGRYRVLVPAGAYYLYVIDPTGAHTAGFHGAPTLITVSASGLVQADPVMAPTGGRVLGTITDDNDGRNLTGSAWALALNASSGAPEVVADNNFNGFDFADLAPGRHLFIFLDATGGHRPEYYDNAPGPDTATSVLVNPGDQITANVAMAPATPPTGGAPLTGTVTEQGTGAPLSGVRVVALHAATYQFAASTTTGTNGGYTVNLNPGRYKIAFVEPTGRHNMEWHNNLPYNGLASAASVTAPGVVNAALAPNTAAMAGTIVDDTTSAPVAGAWVLAIGPTGVTGGAVTVPDGTYEIDGLTPGTYRAVILDPNGGRTLEYHPDSPDYAGAIPFNLTAGTTTTIDAALHHP